MQFVALPPEFYAPSAEEVAPKLLAHWLIRRTPEGFCGGPIVEVEAYLNGDPASHGFIGQTPRNRVMYGPPGFGYVYFIYGSHCCVNVVCRPAGIAEAILIRAIEPQFGVDLLRRNRPVPALSNLTNGPGKLCAAMNIDRQLNGVNLCDANSEVIIARNPDAESFVQHHGPVVRTTRIGLTKAAAALLRYYLDRSHFVSRRRTPR